MRASRMLRRLAQVRHVPRYVEEHSLVDPVPRRILVGYDVVPRESGRVVETPTRYTVSLGAHEPSADALRASITEAERRLRLGQL